MTISMIISGGQTGADRGGLDAAIELGLQRGGAAPRGWKAEDGVIPEHYRPGMWEADGGYRFRTGENVLFSGATLIVSFGRLELETGSMLTAKLARRMCKPYRHFTIDQLTSQVGQRLATDWLVTYVAGADSLTEGVLNVAGPRESKEPGIQAATCAALVSLLRGAAW